jgi:antitoxin MazE
MVYTRASVKKWGNSAAVRIPAPVLESAGVELEDEVDIHVEGGRIVIEPVRRKTYELSELVQGITRDNLHREIDFGDVEGSEAW